jgi:hypothetical protein
MTTRGLEMKLRYRNSMLLIAFLFGMALLFISCGGGDGDSPMVDAGPDRNVGTGAVVTLDGSGSEGIDKDTVTCSWSFASVPTGSALTDADIAGADTATPTFTPDVEGAYVLSLEVDNGMFNGTDAVTVTAWTTFEKTFGGANDDVGNSVQQTADGGFIVAGKTSSSGAGVLDVYLIKTDASGTLEWEKTYGGIYNDFGNSALQTTDGGFIIAGYTYSYGAGDTDVYLIKTDSNGNHEWEKTYGGASYSSGNSVQQTTDGGFVISGSYSLYGTNQDVYLIKADASGNPEWEKTYGGGLYNDDGNSVQQTIDGGFVISGNYSYGWPNQDVYLVKTDASGTPEWEKTYGGPGTEFGNSVKQTSDGGFVVLGSTSSCTSCSHDVYLIKTDASGNVEWEKTYGGASIDGGYSVDQTSDGGFIVAGYTYSFGAGIADVYLIKTDALGNPEWEKTYGGLDYDFGTSIRQTNEGGFIVTGYTYSYGAGGYDVYLIKTDSMGNVY